MSGFAGAMLLGTRWMLADSSSSSISVGEFVFTLVIINQVLWPLANFGTMVRLQIKSITSLSRVTLFLDRAPLPSSRMHEQSTPVEDDSPAFDTFVPSEIDVDTNNIRGEIEFDNIDFQYPAHSNRIHYGANRMPSKILDRVSLHVSAGRAIGVYGANGSGKTTLVKLLTRIFEPNGGTIRIDGYDIRAWSRVSIRRAIAIMPQHSYLFEGSIRDNVVYGSNTAQVDETRVEQSLRLAGASSFIARLPGGTDGLLLEGGANLSDGQRRRLVLARALYKASPILILDHPTADADRATMRALLANLPAIVAQHRTTILLSDNAAVLRKLERILVLHRGRIVEEGSHEALLHMSNGVYAKRWHEFIGE
jgi:ATP-binding cassette, subfamily B, bacterial